MKFSYNWLKEWLDLSISAQELADQLTMAGLEVDSVALAAPKFDSIVIGQVMSVEKHPNADKLQICTVDVGDNSEENLVIVCGAKNVKENFKYPVALIACVLPNGMKIKKSKLRDVESFGMLCSEQELGLADSSSGLLELPSDAAVGANIRQYLDLDDTVIEIDITPNRGDCLGLSGIAREVGVLTNTNLKQAVVKSLKATTKNIFPVKVSEAKACPRYVGRVISDINSSALTPMWMQERLRRCGLRSLGPLVDVTNYVLLEYGQPMHAFDLEELSGSIDVRYAKKKEKLTLLDGKKVSLDEDVLVIADDNRILALAGIMGGEGSAISDSTKNLFLECAFFTPQAIVGRARRFGLQTDSSYRFERGVDPESQLKIMERASQLLISIVGGYAGPVINISSATNLPKKEPIILRQERITRVLGVDIAWKQSKEILTRLGMKISGGKQEGWKVQAPTFRFDVSIEADLIEEIGRIYGYNNIPMRLPQGSLNISPRSEAKLTINAVQNLLVNRGFQEVITYSFIDEKSQKHIQPEIEAIKLANPMSADMAVMRSSLWPGLLQAIRHNLNRQQTRVSIFETGLSFLPDSNKGSSVEKIEQKLKIAGAMAGFVNSEQWDISKRKVDFYDCKAAVEAILKLACQKEDVKFKATPNPALHPGQSAQIIRAGQVIGWLGKLHPEIQKKQELSEEVLLFELDFESLQEVAIPVFKPLSKYPSIRRDLAVLVDEDISSNQVCETVHAAIPDQLQEIRIFDVYRGEGVEIGRKSLALGLILQDSSRTLVDQEVDTAIEWVVVKLKQDLGASLRE